MAQPNHPFIEALPPATDYLTYLTIIEYNLSKESLLVLQHVLEDERLTSNIGWDLVHLLVPLLPESEGCLQLIARRGNPREVIIKVNEMLENIGHDAEQTPDADEDEGEDEDDMLATEPAKTLLATTDSGGRQQLLAFTHLLAMVGILHPRIKAKRPSRFLVTTVEAVLRGYRGLGSAMLREHIVKVDDEVERQSEPNRIGFENFTAATEALLDLLLTLSSITKPPLPPRTSGNVSAPRHDTPAADPEAEPVDMSEPNLQKQILIAFATHIAETFILCIRQGCHPDVTLWTSQCMHDRFADRLRPNRRMHISKTDALASDCAEHGLARLVEIFAGTLGSRTDKLREQLLHADTAAASVTSSEELLVSESGLLFISAHTALKDMKDGKETFPFDQADHMAVVDRYLARTETLDFRPRSLAIIDAIVTLGWASLLKAADKTAAPVEQENDKPAEEEQEAYNRYLQQLSMISANAPFPELRYQVHFLITTIIHSTRNAELRLGYIQDTLECCPFDNLKVTAVGWLKDEVRAAFGLAKIANMSRDERDIFKSPKTLVNVGAVLFYIPDTSNDAERAPGLVPYWLAVLNLLYLLCSNVVVQRKLEVGKLVRSISLEMTFIAPLEELSAQLLGGEETEAFHTAIFSDASLLSDAIVRAKEGLARLKGVENL